MRLAAGRARPGHRLLDRLGPPAADRDPRALRPARSSASARPMPLPPPVMAITRPSMPLLTPPPVLLPVPLQGEHVVRLHVLRERRGRADRALHGVAEAVGRPVARQQAHEVPEQLRQLLQRLAGRPAESRAVTDAAASLSRSKRSPTRFARSAMRSTYGRSATRKAGSTSIRPSSASIVARAARPASASSCSGRARRARRMQRQRLLGGEGGRRLLGRLAHRHDLGRRAHPGALDVRLRRPGSTSSQRSASASRRRRTGSARGRPGAERAAPPAGSPPPCAAASSATVSTSPGSTAARVDARTRGWRRMRLR